MDLDIFDNFATVTQSSNQTADFQSSSTLLESSRKKRKLEEDENEFEERSTKNVAQPFIIHGFYLNNYSFVYYVYR